MELFTARVSSFENMKMEEKKEVLCNFSHHTLLLSLNKWVETKEFLSNGSSYMRKLSFEDIEDLRVRDSSVLQVSARFLEHSKDMLEHSRLFVHKKAHRLPYAEKPIDHTRGS